MSNLIAARVQMGNSLAFHIVFVVLAMGMPLMLCIAEGLALWRKDPSGCSSPVAGPKPSP